MVMGMLHTRANSTKQLEASCHTHLPPIAPCIDRLPVDIVHHEVGQGIVRASAVDDPGNRGVIERREDLALLAKARDDVAVTELSDDFYGDALVERVVDPVGQIHSPHPAASDFSANLIRT